MITKESVSTLWLIPNDWEEWSVSSLSSIKIRIFCKSTSEYYREVHWLGPKAKARQTLSECSVIGWLRKTRHIWNLWGPFISKNFEVDLEKITINENFLWSYQCVLFLSDFVKLATCSKIIFRQRKKIDNWHPLTPPPRKW